MRFHLIIKPEAEMDLDRACNWYRFQAEGLERDFIACIEAALEFIREHPYFAPVIESGVRRKIVQRFPYGILYIIQERAIYVIRVVHLRQDFTGLLKRIGAG
jgi:plasmid stabilization system protein ParE